MLAKPLPRAVLALALLFLSGIHMVIANTSSNASASIDDFSFLHGHWRGEGLGGEAEEMWMPPVGERMFGIFTQSQNSELNFSEFMEIVAVEGEFLLRLKHYSPDFNGWEAKEDYMSFELISVNQNSAVFSGLSYELVSPDQLKVSLTLRSNQGAVRVEEFNYTRVLSE